MAMAAGTAEPIGPARLLQGCHRYAEAKGITRYSSVPKSRWNSGSESPFCNWILLRAMTGLMMLMCQTKPLACRSQSELGNQDDQRFREVFLKC